MSLNKFTLKIFIGLFLFCFQANAQISTREVPDSNDCNYNNSTPFEPYAFSTSGARILANNILCELYGICIEDEMIRGFQDDIDLRKSVKSASSACKNTAENITLYPNTGKNYITVISKAENCRFELINTTGSVVISVSLNQGNNTINTSSLNQGVYIYRATINNETISGKWVKN